MGGWSTVAQSPLSPLPSDQTLFPKGHHLDTCPLYGSEFTGLLTLVLGRPKVALKEEGIAGTPKSREKSESSSLVRKSWGPHTDSLDQLFSLSGIRFTNSVEHPVPCLNTPGRQPQLSVKPVSYHLVWGKPKSCNFHSLASREPMVCLGWGPAWCGRDS